MTARGKVRFWQTLPYGIFAVVSAWLLWCAWTMDVEYYDGYDTLYNARFFAGLAPSYVENRFPLFALLLMPVEILKSHFHIPPMDLRWDHLVSAALHGGYLFLSWFYVKRLAGGGRAASQAFLLIVPNVLFACYAPFLNHDIVPGLILLAMLALALTWAVRPTVKMSVSLLVLGTLALLIKPVFGIFWLSVFAVVLMDGVQKKMNYRALGLTAGLTGVSVGLFLLIMAVVLTSAKAHLDIPFLLRPVRQLTLIAAQYPGPRTLFPLWLYVANLPAAWGWAASALLIPAWVGSVRNGGRSAALAVAWLVSFLALHTIFMREVRYMAFLAPLTACLLTPLVRSLWIKSKPILVIVMLLWVADGSRAFVEAASFNNRFFRQSQARWFLAPLEKLDGLSKRLVFANKGGLGFVSPIPSPFVGDRYQGFFHLGLHHIGLFTGIGHGRFVIIPPEYHLIENMPASLPLGSIVLLNSQVLANDSQLKALHPREAESLQSLSVVEAGRSGPKFTVLRRARAVYMY